MAKEFNEGDGEGVPQFPRCEGCNRPITNEQVDGTSFKYKGKTYYITYRCATCTESEFVRIWRDVLGLHK